MEFFNQGLMFLKINLNNQVINYQLKNSQRARSLRLCLNYDGGLLVIKPVRLSLREVEEFLQAKADWVIKKRSSLAKRKKRNPQIFCQERGQYLKHKEEARCLVHKTIERFNRYYGFSYGQVRIGNQKTVWGSCSALGNLNYNYKLIFLPVTLADYVVVHELCHLKELNHSSNFWQLVAKTIPDYKERVAKLREL